MSSNNKSREGKKENKLHFLKIISYVNFNIRNAFPSWE